MAFLVSSIPCTFFPSPASSYPLNVFFAAAALFSHVFSSFDSFALCSSATETTLRRMQNIKSRVPSPSS